MASSVFAATSPGSKTKPSTLGGLSLSATASEYFFSGSDQRNATPLYGLKIGYDKISKSIADSLGVEGTVNYFASKLKTNTGEATGYLFRLDATYPFVVAAKWMPFLAVGGGGIVIADPSHTDTSPVFNYGAGLKYFLEDYLAARVDARHLVVYNSAKTSNNFEVGVGMSYYFGKERKKKPVPPPPPPPLKLELKEDENIETKTDGTGIVPPPPAVENIEKTAQAKVAAPPVLPPAPSPPPAALSALEPVRKTVEKKIVRKLSVGFVVNSYYVKQKYHEKLKEFADIMKSSPDATARVEGHTDSTGKLKYNIKLSKLRAQSVRDTLTKFGIDPGRISAVGYGPSRPIADNATIQGRQKNRQAETLVTLTVYE
jgi:OOP family OmpA-OmpF porin